MILPFIAYSFVVAAFAAIEAWLLEVAFARFGRARRVIWIVAIAAALVLPPLATLLQEPAPRPSAVSIDAASAITFGHLSLSQRDGTAPGDALVAGASVDAIAAAAWGLLTACVLAFHVFGALRLARRARHWRSSRVDSHPVSVAPDIGPALYGWWRPRVVFPAWLLAAPDDTRRHALAHEREHLAAHDPQILAAATILFALLPWNVPLFWMLRRLRFAMEVDCDARVVRAGADASDYGLALLFVSERQARPPVVTLALIERPSQLERRINIMVSSPRHRALVAGLCTVLAGSCVLAASRIEAPARLDETRLKPVPDGDSALKLGYAFEQYIQKRYAGLLDEDVGGTAIVIALVNADMSVAKSAQVISREAIENIKADASMFEAIGMSREEVPYLGAMGMQSPSDPQRKLLVVYTEQRTPGERFVSKLAPNTSDLDREIFHRTFPDSVKNGVPAGARPWILIDRRGQVLRSGVETVSPKELNAMLEAQFAGIKTRETTVTSIVDEKDQPVKDRGGAELHMFSVWLAPESPLPKD